MTSWWRHQMETFSAWLALCAENSPVPGEFSAQRPVTRSFDVFFGLHMNKQLSKQCGGWWFETHSGSLWRQCNVIELGQHCSRQWLVACFAPSHYPNQCWLTVAWIVGNKLMSSFQVQSYILSCKPNTYILLSYSWFICLHDKNIKPTTNNYFVVLREVIVLIYCSRGTVAIHQELSDLTMAWSRQIYDQRFKMASNLQVFW